MCINLCNADDKALRLSYVVHKLCNLEALGSPRFERYRLRPFLCKADLEALGSPRFVRYRLRPFLYTHKAQGSPCVNKLCAWTV